MQVFLLFDIILNIAYVVKKYYKVKIMAEKRKIMRLQKRLKLRYGVNNATSVAFTEDFSESGIFIRAVNVILPGSKLLIELFLPDNDTVVLEARIIWGRRVPGSLIHLAKKSGMGVLITKILANEEKYREFCRALTERRSPHPPTQSPAPVSRDPEK